MCKITLQFCNFRDGSVILSLDQNIMSIADKIVCIIKLWANQAIYADIYVIQG